MNWISFHHPDWSLPVIRRRAQEEWIDLLEDYAELLTSAGRSHLWKHTYPNLRSYHNSMSRLRKSGLIVQHHNDGRLPVLKLTPKGRGSLPEFHFPEKYWNSKWSGIWYTLIFDVPENQRHYRDTLRRFMKRMRMGCLQRSVWITPRDIRPEYDDLQRAANVNAVSYLLESRTVLHQDTAEMVENAWNFGALRLLQERYCQVFKQNLKRLETLDHDVDALLILLQQEAEAYIQAMQNDPLLPEKLLPATYLGREVYELRRKLRKTVGQHLEKYIV